MQNPLTLIKAYLQQVARSADALTEIRAGIIALNNSVNNAQPGLPMPMRPSIEVAPLQDFAAPAISLDSARPAEDIMASPEFTAVREFFAASPAAQRALVSPDTQALLYLILRIMKPANAVEIGSFRVSTTEALARAIWANKRGVIHTIDPFGLETVPALLGSWPYELRQHVRFHPVSSMDFFGQAARHGSKFGLIFVDGNHDYEFALFDILSAARALEPGGLVIADNIAQPGPYLAVLDFLAQNPGWRQWGAPLHGGQATGPYDRNRVTIPNTDCVILQSPRTFVISAHPRSFGYQFYQKPELSALNLNLSGPAQGKLDIQLIMRTFVPEQVETIINHSVDIDSAGGALRVSLPDAFRWTPNTTNSAEPWFTWRSDAPLVLSAPPELSDR